MQIPATLSTRQYGPPYERDVTILSFVWGKSHSTPYSKEDMLLAVISDKDGILSECPLHRLRVKINDEDRND